MTELLTVGASRPSRSVSAAVASLPRSLSLVDGVGDLAVIDGSAGWPDRLAAAVDRGARGAMIVNPLLSACSVVPVDPGIPVVVDTAWAWNPAVREGASELGRLDGASSIDANVVTDPATDLRDVLLHQTVLLRSAGLDLEELSLIRRSDNGYDATGRRSNRGRISVTATLTNALPASAWVRAISEACSVELSIPDPSTAQPATLRVTDSSGDVLRPTHYESAHRVAWRTLHDLVVSGGASDSLANLAKDAAIVVRSLGS